MGEEALFCELCKLNFSTKEELVEHDWSLLHHRKLDKEKGRDTLHTCILCKEDVFGLLAFTKHIHSEKHLSEVTKLKYSESEIDPADSTPLQETCDTSNTGMQSTTETIPLPAAHFLPRARYFQSLENPLSSTPLMDTTVKNVQPQPWKPYRFTPQHRPYVPPRSNFRPRFQNPFRYVKPGTQSNVGSPHMDGADAFPLYPKSPNKMTSTGITYNNETSTNTYPNTTRNGFGKKSYGTQPVVNTLSYEPSPMQTNARHLNSPGGKHSNKFSTNSKSNAQSIENSFTDVVNTCNSQIRPLMNNFMDISPPLNDSYVSNRLNFSKNKYPSSSVNTQQEQADSTNLHLPLQTNDQSRENSNIPSPLTKRQKLERYLIKNEIRLKSKKRALMRQNSLRRKNGNQSLTRSFNSSNDSNGLNSSLNSETIENINDISNQGRKVSFARPKSTRQDVLKEPRQKNNSIQDNLNLNVQFVLRKGREIVNKYNKGFNKEYSNNTDARKNVLNTGQFKLPNMKQGGSSTIDFTSQLKSMRRFNSSIRRDRISNHNVRIKNNSHLENGVSHELSESAQILLQKTKPVRVKVSALSPTTLSVAKKTSKDDRGPLWNNAIDQVNLQQKHQKYLRKFVKAAMRENDVGKKSIDMNPSPRSSKQSASFVADASISTGSNSSLQSSLASLYEHSNQKVSHVPTSNAISISADSIYPTSVVSNVDASHLHSMKTSSDRFLHRQKSQLKTKPTEIDKHKVTTSSPVNQKDGQTLNSSAPDSNVPFDMEKVVNELLSMSPGFEYLAYQNRKKRKKKKLRILEQKKHAVNKGLGTNQTERLMKKFEMYQKARERCKENAVPGENVKAPIDNTPTPVERRNEAAVVKRRFRKPISTCNLDKLTGSAPSSDDRNSFDVNRSKTSDVALVIPSECNLSKQNAKHAENASTETEKNDEPSDIQKRLIQISNSSDFQEGIVPSEEPCGQLQKRNEALHSCDDSVDMEDTGNDSENLGVQVPSERRNETAKIKRRFRQVTSSNLESLHITSSDQLLTSKQSDLIFSMAKDNELLLEGLQNEGSHPTEKRNDGPKIKRRFRQISASENIEHLSAAPMEPIDQSNESNESDLSGNTSKDIESIAMEEDQGMVLLNQPEKEDSQKESSISGNVNEVISLDDDDDVELTVEDSNKNNKEAAAVQPSDNSKNLKENAKEMKIKFRFRPKSKSVTVNDNRSASDIDGSHQSIDSSKAGGSQKRKSEEEANHNSSKLRAPIICLLGHIEAGKTSLLNKVRGITFPSSNSGAGSQQVAASNIHAKKLREITKIVKEFQEFNLMLPGLLVLDTPGQKSLSNLRSSGSAGCDMAILVVDITVGLEPQSTECIRLLRRKRTPFIIALNKIDKILEWAKSPHQEVEETIAQQKTATALDFEQKVNLVIKQLSEQGVDAALHYKSQDHNSCISLVPTSADTGDGISNLMALVCRLTQLKQTRKEINSEEMESTTSEAKTGEAEEKEKKEASSLPQVEEKEESSDQQKIMQSSASLNVEDQVSTPDATLSCTEEVILDNVTEDKSIPSDEAPERSNHSRTLQRSFSESEASQASADGESLQKLISNYVYDSEVESFSEKKDEATGIPASVITGDLNDDDKDKVNTGHHCEFKKNNGTYCENVTSTRFCDYHQRVLKAVELFISKRVASGPSKVSDAVSLIDTPEKSLDKHDSDGENLITEKSKTSASKRRLSENSNDGEVDGVHSEGEKRIDLSTSRFRRKKCKSVCLQSEESDSNNSQIDLSISSLSKKVGKQPRFKYLRNLTTCQSEVNKSNLPPTVRKLLDKKHNTHAIVPNVRMPSHSQSESESEINPHEKRMDENTSHSLDNASCDISDTDDISESTLGDKAHSSQASSLHDSDISDLSLLQRLHETIQPVCKVITPTQDINPISAPDPNMLERLFSIQAPVFSKTMSPTVTHAKDVVSEILFNVNQPSSSSTNSLPGNSVVTAKALPVNVIKSAMSSSTSVVSAMNQPIASSIAVMSSPINTTSTKSMPVSVIMTPVTSVISVTNDISPVNTKSFSISVITKPSATPGKVTDVIVMPSRSLSLDSSMDATTPINMPVSTSLVHTTNSVSIPSAISVVTDCVISSPASVIQPTQICSAIQFCKVSDPLSSSGPGDCSNVNCDEQNISLSESPCNENTLEMFSSSSLPSVDVPLVVSDLVTSTSEKNTIILDSVSKCNTLDENTSSPPTDFTEHETDFIDCVKTRRSAKRNLNKVTENVTKMRTDDDILTVSECTSVTTSCYVPVISSSINSSIDVETITTLFCFKGPILSNSSNVMLGTVTSTSDSSTERTTTSTSITASDDIPVILEPTTESSGCLITAPTSNDLTSTSNEMCIDLTTNESTDLTSKHLGSNIESVTNNSLVNSLNSNCQSELCEQSNANCSEENSIKYFTPDSSAKHSPGKDINKPMQSSFIRNCLNENDVSASDKFPFQEELSVIEKTDVIKFHSINSDHNSTGCSEMSCDESVGDTNSTFENFQSFESDDGSRKEDEREIVVKDGDADDPDMIKDIIPIPIDSDDETECKFSESDIGEETISGLEKELNKLQTDEDDALDKLTKANKSLERLKIEMGKLQDEISLHANNMQKISAEKKKLRLTLQQWRSLRVNSVNRTPIRNSSCIERSPNDKINQRKSVNSSVDVRECTSSDENLPLSFTKDKKILEALPADENIRVVKSICVYDSVSSRTDNSSDHSENGSGYDTAPSSPEKNGKDTPKKDRKDKKNQENDTFEQKKPERLNSLRCRRLLRERPSKLKS